MCYGAIVNLLFSKRIISKLGQIIFQFSLHSHPLNRESERWLNECNQTFSQQILCGRVCLHLTNCNINIVDKIEKLCISMAVNVLCGVCYARIKYTLTWKGKRENKVNPRAYITTTKFGSIFFGKMWIRREEWWWWRRRKAIARAIALPNQNFSNKLWAIDLNRQKNQDDQFPKPYGHTMLSTETNFWILLHFFYIYFRFLLFLFCPKSHKIHTKINVNVCVVWEYSPHSPYVIRKQEEEKNPKHGPTPFILLHIAYPLLSSILNPLAHKGIFVHFLLPCGIVPPPPPYRFLC